MATRQETAEDLVRAIWKSGFRAGSGGKEPSEDTVDLAVRYFGLAYHADLLLVCQTAQRLMAELYGSSRWTEDHTKVLAQLRMVIALARLEGP
jgi:hypothetical protein